MDGVISMQLMIQIFQDPPNSGTNYEIHSSILRKLEEDRLLVVCIKDVVENLRWRREKQYSNKFDFPYNIIHIFM